MGKRISVKEEKKIFALYEADPNIEKIVRRLKRNQLTVRRSLLRQGVQLGGVEGVADAIIRRIEKDPTAFSKNFEQLARMLGSSDVVGVLRNPDKYREAVVMQARTNLLMALSFLMEGDKLQTASPSAVAQIVPVLAEIASGKYNLGAGKPESVDSDKIIESIQICLKRVRSFNPVLAKETEEVVKGVIDLPAEAFKEVKNGDSDSV